MPQPYSTNSNYRSVIRSLLRIHQIWIDGKGESPDADAIRDAMDGPWELLSEMERKRIRGLSEDLNCIESQRPDQTASEMNPQAQGKLVEAYDAIARCELDRALELLRRWARTIAPALLSFLRGRAWFAAGDSETAVVFYEHAVRIEPSNPNYRAVLLECLKSADPTKAISQSEEILHAPDAHAAAVVVHAAEILYGSAKSEESDADSLARCNRLIPIVEQSLQKLEQDQYLDELAILAALMIVAGCYRTRGDTQIAVAYYSRALQIDPTNAPMFAARGILLYGTSPRAIEDFEVAVQLDSPVIWPYFFLAHYFVTNSRFEECRSMCERGLRQPGPQSAKSELWAWRAISQAELGFPTELVHTSFENAIRTDPSNDRARNNFAIFEEAQRSQPRPIVNWEKRSASLLRTFGVEEMRRSNFAARPELAHA